MIHGPATTMTTVRLYYLQHLVPSTADTYFFLLQMHIHALSVVILPDVAHLRRFRAAVRPQIHIPSIIQQP